MKYPTSYPPSANLPPHLQTHYPPLRKNTRAPIQKYLLLNPCLGRGSRGSMLMYCPAVHERIGYGFEDSLPRLWLDRPHNPPPIPLPLWGSGMGGAGGLQPDYGVFHCLCSMFLFLKYFKY